MAEELTIKRSINIGDEVILHEGKIKSKVKDIYYGIEPYGGAGGFFVDLEREYGKIESVPLWMIEELLKDCSLYPAKSEEFFDELHAARAKF